MQNENLWREYVPTARGAEEHFEDLGLKLDDLKGKKILDIGSGLNQLANELKPLGIDITSLDPFYGLSREEREAIYKRGYEDGPEKLKEFLDQLESKDSSSSLVAGRSEALPFNDESFDLAISHYGSPFYAKDADKIKKFFFELNRVLKSGGEARLYPTWLKEPTTEKSSAQEKVFAKLKESGFHIEKHGGAWILKKGQKS